MRLALALAALLPLAPAAHAFEPTGSIVADAFLANLQAGGYDTVRAGPVSREDGTIVIAQVTAAGGDARPQLAIGEVRLVDAAVGADDRLTADAVEYEAVEIAQADGSTRSTIAAARLAGASFPLEGEDEDGRLSGLVGSFDRLSFEDVATTTPDGREVRVGAIEVTLSGRDPAERLAGTLSVADLAFDTALMGPNASRQLAALGYDRLSTDLSLDATWRADGGAARIDDATIRVDDVGTLRVRAAVDGLTPATLDVLTAGSPDLAEALAALNDAAITTLTVSFDDAGITDRLLDASAEAAGLAREAYVRGLVAVLDQGLGTLDAPAFAEDVRSAVRRFLDDPGTISVAANPTTPLSLAQVIGIGMMRPAALPTLLNVTVTAGE